MVLAKYALALVSVFSSAGAVPSLEQQSLAGQQLPKGQHKSLKLDIEVLHGNSVHDASVHKRPGLARRSDDSGQLELTNMETFYQAVIYVGSNREKCRVSVDTGSSDLWVMGNEVICQYKPKKKKKAKEGEEKVLQKRGDQGEEIGEIGEIEGDEIGGDEIGGDEIEGVKRIEKIKEIHEIHEIKEIKETEEIEDTGSEGSSGKLVGSLRNSTTLNSTALKTPLTPLTPPNSTKTSNSKILTDSSTQKESPDYFDFNEFIKHLTPVANSKAQNACIEDGVFHPLYSNTFHFNDTAPLFDMVYTDDSFVQGFWGTDTVGFSNNEVTVSFAVANKSSTKMGMLGLGPKLGEMTVDGEDSDYTYSNFPTQLKKSGIIKTVAYSVFLNKDKAAGSILFGAVDHKKYIGQLQKVPYVNMYLDYEMIDSSSIVLDRIFLESDHQKVTIMNEPIAATLDSASPMQDLPKNVLLALVSSMRGRYSKKAHLYQVKCAYTKNSGNLVYEFSGIQIRVPISDLVTRIDGNCYLAIRICESEVLYASAYLGNVFLKHAYVVYDLDNLEIAMAQANYSEEEEVEEINGSIPGAVKAARYSSTDLVIEVQKDKAPRFKHSDGMK